MCAQPRRPHLLQWGQGHAQAALWAQHRLPQVDAAHVLGVPQWGQAGMAHLAKADAAPLPQAQAATQDLTLQTMAVGVMGAQGHITII